MTSIVSKPWGSFEVLEQGSQYTLKKINVIPGGILSLQSHFHRSEHWVVAQGAAEATLDDRIITLNINEHIFIPKGSKHRLANKGLENLIIIEVWYGDILEETDIVRYEDIYARI